MTIKTIFPTGDYYIASIISSNNIFNISSILAEPLPSWETNDGVPYDTNGTKFWQYLNDIASSGDNASYVRKTVYSSLNNPSGIQSITSGTNDIDEQNDYSSSWSSLSNISQSDYSYAISSGNAHTIHFKDFGIDLPYNVDRVTGIECRVHVSGNTDGADGCRDVSVRLIKNNGVQGNNKVIGTNWSDGHSILSYGASGDLWGFSAGAISIADVEANDFGFAFQAESDDLLMGIDYVEMSVYYNISTSGTDINQVSKALFQFETEPLENLIPQAATLNIRYQSEYNGHLYYGDLIDKYKNISLLDSNERTIAYFETDDNHFYNDVGSPSGVNLAAASSGNPVTISIPLTMESGNISTINTSEKMIINIPISIEPSSIPAGQVYEDFRIYDLDIEISGKYVESNNIPLFISTYSVCATSGDQIFYPAADIDSDGPWQQVPNLGAKFRNVDDGVEFDNGFTDYLRNTGGAGISYLEFASSRPTYFPTVICTGCSSQEIKFSMSSYMEDFGSGVLPVEVTAIEFSQNGNTLAYEYAGSTTPGSGEGLFQIKPDGQYRYMDMQLTIPSGASEDVLTTDTTSIRVQFYDPNTFFYDWQIGSLQVSLCGESFFQEYNESINLYSLGHQLYTACGSGDDAFSSAFGVGFGRNDCVNLYTKGLDVSSGNIDLYTFGLDAYALLDLYSEGHGASNSGIDLYTLGHTEESGNIELFTKASFTDSNSLNMYLAAPVLNSSDANLNLYTWGTTESGIYDNINLFVQSFDDPTHYNSLNMTAFGEGTFDATNSLNLFIKTIGNSDGSISYSDNINLVSYNDVESIGSGISLYTSGTGETDGAVPYNNSLNLYIARGNDSTANRIDMYISGPTPESGNLDLFLEGRTYVYSGIELYTVSHENSGDSITLYTHGF